MALPGRLARFNRVVTNRITRPLARRLPLFAVVHHRGRRSGRSYATPVNVFPGDGSYVIALTYGADADWVRNVVAAGGCVLEHRRRLRRLGSPRLLGAIEGMAAMPRPVRLVLRLLEVTAFLELKP